MCASVKANDPAPLAPPRPSLLGNHAGNTASDGAAGKRVDDMNWYQDHQALYDFSFWLLANAPMFTVLDVMDLLKEPWQWQEQYEVFETETNAMLQAYS